jgi:flagellar basal body-associated protein FliL
MGSNKVLKISIGIVLVVALTYGILSMFFGNKSGTNTKFSGFGKVMVPSSRSKTSTVSTNKLDVNLDTILAPLSKGDYRYMKADISFKMSNKQNKEALMSNMSQTRNVVLRFSATRDSNKLATERGKEKYKKDLKNVISDNLGYQIDGVYFRNFVLAK